MQVFLELKNVSRVGTAGCRFAVSLDTDRCFLARSVLSILIHSWVLSHE